MPEYLSPGVYVEEVAGGPRPIQGVGTSTAGFVGLAERGPTRPRLVTGWGDFLRWFGDTLDPAQSFMPFGVRGFFENEGQRAFVARVTGANAGVASLDLPTTAGPGNELRIAANGAGAWGGRILVRVQDATRADSASVPPRNWFRITVLYYRDAIPSPFIDPTSNANVSNPRRREPDVLEDFDNLTHEIGRSNNVVNVLNRSSQLLDVEFVGAAARPTNLDFLTPTRAQFELVTADANTMLRVAAIIPGPAGDALSVSVETGTNANTFRIKVLDGGVEAENFDNIPDGTPNQVLTDINGNSLLITVAWVQANPPNPITPSRPLDGAANLAGGTTLTSLLGGTDGAAIVAGDFIGNPAADPNLRTGLAGLALIDEVALIVAPDEVRFPPLTNALVDQCESLRDRFAILSVPAGSSGVQNINPPRDSSYGAVYYPWIRVYDTRTQDNLLVPPAGHIAGIYARTDVQRGVHKAPANEIVKGMIYQDINATRKPLEFTLSKGGQDILNPRGVNVIRDFRADRRSIRVWGARTMSSDPLWRYINVRRLFLYVEESIDEGTQWVVFEPNDESTWARVRQVVTNFLTLVWRSGALQGSSEEQAFFVRCGPDTMTSADIDAGRLICEVGIAPVKPAEFVIFRIQQKTFDLNA
ncbi:MAG: phage tail sheath subtilisin-like domain-containing protein [Pirellulaceae bacterium]